MNTPHAAPFGAPPNEDEPGQDATAAEIADVKEWHKRIKRARAFDENARAQYALDRSYVSGDAGRSTFEVTTNIAGTYVDILVSFLYARDPAADVLPSESAGTGRTEFARKLGKTLEPVIKRLWKNGRLKPTARKWVRSGLSIGVGWFKATWHERTGSDPVSATKANDLQDNAEKLARLERELGAGECEYPEQVQAEIDQLRAGMVETQEVLLSRGMVIDFVSGEDITLPEQVPSQADYLESPWMAHRMFMPVDEAKATFTRIAELLGNATAYTQVKPKAGNERADPGPLADLTAKDADAYREGAGSIEAGAVSCVCVHEIWNKDANTIITVIEGVERYARDPFQPDPATERWYPFFRWAPIEVDGKRHPQSLPSRSAPQLDEYNRIRSNHREHRRRAIPKLGFDSRTVDKDNAAKMEAGGVGEMIGLDLRGDADPSKALFPISYNAIDPALYDTSEIRAELEMIWGIQEALSSTIRTAKTLGEAEIQQSGTEARESFKRDSMEEEFTDFAIYTAEIALQKCTREDVVAMAGPEAFWPPDEVERLTIADLALLVSVEIRAGSTGKPNTAARRQAWGVLLPQLQAAIMQIGQLRGATPQQMADCLEQLVVETIERAGDRLDPSRFIPQAPVLPPAPAPSAVPGAPVDPLAPPGAAVPPPAAVPALAPPQPPMEA